MSELIYKLNKTAADVDELLLQHKNLVYYRLAQMNQLTNQDAESAAWEALWDSIMTFDVFGDTAFSTYACRCITNAINTVLRKQQHDKRNTVELNELTEANLLFTDDSYESADTMQRVDEAFKIYISTCKGKSRDVLLLWRASGFEMSATALAKQCATSTSYVARVQCSFRAFLSCQLRG